MSFKNQAFPRVALLFGGVFLSAAISIRACGPDFPNAYLTYSGEELAKLPTLSFAGELTRLLPTGNRPKSTSSPTDDSGQPREAELAEIRAILRDIVGRRDLEKQVSRYTRGDPGDRLPQEFHLYAAGARAWHDGKSAEAINPWRALLSLPEAERRHRTTWAFYMIGRALWNTDAPAARTAFQNARTSAANKFTDVLGLAPASLGWEARTHLTQKDYAPALRLYFEQYAAGEADAMVSLQLTMQQLFGEVATAADPAKLLTPVASDKHLRGIVTAWFVSRGGPSAPWSFQALQQFLHWLAALPAATDLDAAEADRWAWAAYQNALWDEAAAFAQRAPADAPASAWVRAMLCLRAGDVAGATQHLAAAAKAFPQDPGLRDESYKDDDRRFYSTHENLPQATLSAVSGVLALQRTQFVESLRLFLQAGQWTDAAYVAERVLTLDELIAFVRQEVPKFKEVVPNNAGHDDVWPPSGPATNNLRHLLARRLVRAMRFDDAREFFPPDLQATYDRYVALVRDGYREENPRQLRGLALWQAAQIVHESGMELQGTELAPDFSIWGGSFGWPNISRVRLTDQDGDSRWSWYERKNWTGLGRMTVASEEEYDRAQKIKNPDRRFHYRQRAAQLAMLAATLLPDNDELTATILHTAGRWIAARFPDDAEIFYKTLVLRCPKTKLGRAAGEKHWFVDPS